MSKLKINKRILSLILAGAITTGGIGFAIKSFSKDKPIKIENEIGYTDINPLFNNVDSKDFVILDIGDHDDYGKTHFQNRKMQYCNENDISLGVIISTDSEKESEIYDDVEFVKSIVRDYAIGFPVYLNIDGIITNDNLNNEMKTKLIKDFCEKCSANNIYVGLYGTDTNLTRVKEYCNITEYDAFLVMDKKDVIYDGVYNVYQDMDGNIQSKTNIDKLIKRKGLNDAGKFANDGSCIISSEEELIDVALRYNMSINELLEFNGLKKNDIKGSIRLRIPSLIDTDIPTGEITFEELDEPIRGCDISVHQGTKINWDKLAENFEFIIIRCSNGTTTDETFEQNAKNANLNNIPMGVYCYNRYKKTNTENHEEFILKQEEQANKVLELLKNKKVEYPVYLDIERYNNEPSIEDLFTKEQVQDMLKIWKERIAESGYIPGLYCNQSAYKFIQSCVDYDLTDMFEVWLAGGEQYYGENVTIPLEDIVPSENIRATYPDIPIIQATQNATGSGAGNVNGQIDVDYSYTNYENYEYESSATTSKGFDIKEFDRIDYAGLGTAAGALSSVALAGLGIYAFKRKTKGKVKTKNNEG